MTRPIAISLGVTLWFICIIPASLGSDIFIFKATSVQSSGDKKKELEELPFVRQGINPYIELAKLWSKRQNTVNLEVYIVEQPSEEPNPVQRPATVVQATLHHVRNNNVVGEPVAIEVTQKMDSPIQWQAFIPLGAMKANQVYYLEVTAHQGGMDSEIFKVKILVP